MDRKEQAALWAHVAVLRIINHASCSQIVSAIESAETMRWNAENLPRPYRPRRSYA